MSLNFRYLDNHIKGTSQSQKMMRFVIGDCQVKNILTIVITLWNKLFNYFTLNCSEVDSPFIDKIKSGPMRKNSLFEANPASNIFNGFPVADHLVGRKIPIGIPDGNGNDNSFGFGYSGKFM